MKALVIGSGIVGLATAYELAVRGHEVEVIDRGQQQSSATSSATAGLLSPGHSFAWAAPSAPIELVKSLFQKDTSIRVRPRWDPELIAWGLRFLRQCTSTRAHANTLAKLQLAQRSQERFREILATERFAFTPTRGGVLYLYRDEAALKRGLAHGAIMRENGQVQTRLGRDEILALEPALANSTIPFIGAIHGQDDATGDPEQYSLELRNRCEQLGVRFTFGAIVSSIRTDRTRVQSVTVNGEDKQADAYVIAAGVWSTTLARSIGVKLPIYPARGFSMTAPILDGAEAPRLGGLDEKSLIAWSRFGDHMRMSATAEFAGYDTTYRPQDFTNIIRASKELFPGVLDISAARYGVGLRPMTPDGPPLIGIARETNLFYNAGHGHLGWTMAFGSADILADQLEGRSTGTADRRYALNRSASVV